MAKTRRRKKMVRVVKDLGVARKKIDSTLKEIKKMGKLPSQAAKAMDN